MAFKARYPGRCTRCRLHYAIGDEITCTTEPWVTPPEFRHADACPPAVPIAHPEQHVPTMIGTHAEDGTRTHAPPGEVCAGCSDPTIGRWVPVSDCALAVAAREQDGPDQPYPTLRETS
jgi:hypothetical protein